MNHNIESCLVFAARYSHNRNTGAASLVVNAIKDEWDGLEPYTKVQIIKESHEATTNLDTWESFRKFALEKQLT
jgi:hypothetical protein